MTCESSSIIGPPSFDPSYLQLFQHGCLICEAQISTLDTKLLGEVIKVHLQMEREEVRC